MSSNALLKALNVLKLFQTTSEPLTVREISSLVNETESSIQRSVFTLEVMGYIEREEGGIRYVLGSSCLRPAYGYLRNNRFLELATPFLIDLSQRFKTRADLTVLDKTDIVYLSRVPNKDELLNLSPLGRRWPAINTASGRAILAALTETEQHEIIHLSTFAKITPRTTTSPETILEAIKQAKIDGYAYQRDEVLVGAASVGSAITDANGVVHGAIVLGGPVANFAAPEQRQLLGNAVYQTAQAIGAYNLQ